MSVPSQVFGSITIAADKITPEELPITRLSQMESLARLAADNLTGIKIHPLDVYRFGIPALVDMGIHARRLFADLKLRDIAPANLAEYEFICEKMRPLVVTCHLHTSEESLRLLAEANKYKRTILAGVGILSDITPETCNFFYRSKAEDQMLRLVEYGLKHGNLTHTVCSPLEIKAVRKHFPNQMIHAVGLRPEGVGKGAQARVGTVIQAAEDGANRFIIGTAITCAANPEEALHTIAGQIAGVMPA